MAKSEKNFEELIENLEDITNKLEKEKLSLDDSVKLFVMSSKFSINSSKFFSLFAIFLSPITFQ